MLKQYACDPLATKGRLYPEQTTPYRNQFQRDKDRIIHTNAFRRLQYKTQVFINHEGDHYRNRLTHSIEVSGVARSLARALGFCEDLAECVALSHDLGHTPFGHAGEDALDAAMSGYGGFCHNAHSIKLLTSIEKRYAAYNGINLTWEVLEGTAKHNGPVIKDVPLAITEYNKLHPLDLDKYASGEAQIASLSDDIAYHCHDLEDGIRAKLFTLEDLNEIYILRDILKNIHDKFPHESDNCKIYEIVRELAHILINDLVAQTEANIKIYSISSEDDIRNLGRPVISFSEKINNILAEIKTFLFKKVYRHPKVALVTYRCKIVVTKLFNVYFENPQCLPFEWQQKIVNGDDTSKARVIADYIAGMTDRYAIKEYNSLYNFSFQNSF